MDRRLNVLALMAVALLVMPSRPVRPRGHYVSQAAGEIFAGTLATAVTGQLPRERQYEEYRERWIRTGDPAELGRMLECVGLDEAPRAVAHPRPPRAAWRHRLIPAAIGLGWLLSLLWVHRII